MKHRKVTILSAIPPIIILFSAVILFIIFSSLKSNSKNEDTIQAVARQVFTCPNEELILLYSNWNKEIDEYMLEKENDPNSPDTGTYSIDVIAPNSFSKLENKVHEIYSPYFTDRGYELFYKHFMNNHNTYSATPGYQIEVLKVDITQSETIPSNYSFTVFLRYGTIGGEKKDIKVDGSAQVTEEEGKLSYIQFFDRDLFYELKGFKYLLPND